MQFAIARSAVLGLLLAVVCQFALAQTNTIGFPSSSYCSSTQPPIKVGTDPGFPGHWWNPERYGTGWDFFFVPSDPNAIDILWLTFDGSGRPVWLSNGGGNVQTATEMGTGAQQYWAPLYKVSLAADATTTVVQVGQVAVTFLPNSATQAVVRWQWSGVPQQPDECVYNFFKGVVPTGNAPLSESYTGDWYAPSQSGWGISITVGADPKTGVLSEVESPTIYDASGSPVWLFGSQSNPTTASNTIPVTYAKSLYAGGYPTSKCKQQNCSFSYYNAGSVTRSFTNAGTGSANVSAVVPSTFTGSTASQVSWPGSPAHYTAPVAIAKLTDINTVMVAQTTCNVPNAQATCSEIVSWGSTTSSAYVYRYDFKTRTLSTTPLLRSNNAQVTDVLPVGADVRYELHAGGSSTGALLFRSAEVRVGVAPIPAVPDAAITSLSGELPTNDATVGTAAGMAGTDGGSATYTIPISVPPGRNGMQPTLALTYSSRSGSGIAGVGWSLSGTSSIHVCPKTIAQDGLGKGRSVQLDGADALCLDGKRLMVTNGGTYGTAGTAYDTEVRSFSQVTQQGAALNSANSWFKVLEKSGRTLTYGSKPQNYACSTSSVAQVIPAYVTAPMSWMLTRVQDATGNNWIDYCYSTAGAGEIVLSQIVYTGGPSGAGNRAVTLSYALRSGNDWTSSYLAGGLTTQTQRLSQIDTYYGFSSTSAPGEHVRSYGLQYVNGNTVSSHSARSLLASVTECGYVGATACHPPTTFTWSDKPDDVVSSNYTFQNSGVPTPVPSTGTNVTRAVSVIGDFDGDGTREVLITQFQSDGAEHSWLAKFTADRAPQSAVDVTSLYSQNELSVADERIVGDIGGDGHSDFVGGPSGSYFNIYTWNQARGASLSGYTAANLVGTTVGGNALFRSIQTTIPYATTTWPLADAVQAVSDFTGDGFADVLINKANASCSATTTASVYRVLCLYANTTRQPLANVTAPPYSFGSGAALDVLCSPSMSTCFQVLQVTDINGDGLPDVLVGYGSALHHVLWSTTNGSYVPSGCTANTATAYANCPVSAVFPAILTEPNGGTTTLRREVTTAWMDVNGDGLPDLLVGSSTGCTFPDNPVNAQWCISLNTGKGFGSLITVTGSTAGLDVDQAGGLLRASKLPQVDIDSSGRAQLLYPVALAAQICYEGLLYSDTGECPGDTRTLAPGSGEATTNPSGLAAVTVKCYYYVCSKDPSGKYSLPSVNGTQSIPVGSSPGAAAPFDADESVYSMGAIRFEQTGPQSFIAVTASLDTSATNGATHKVLASIDAGPFTRAVDMFGDGLGDLVTQLGCTAYTNSEKGLTYCLPQAGGTDGPTTLPDGSPVSSLQNGALLYLNENVGAGAQNNDQLAPVLPELLTQAKNGLGDTALWDYFPLSSNAGRGNSTAVLPLYTWNSTSGISYVADSEYYYFQSSMPVVSLMTQSNGVGSDTGSRSYSYGYEGAIYDHLGRGFQGFRVITQDPLIDASEVDANGRSRAIRTRTIFEQKFPLTGRVQEQDTGIATSGTTLSIVAKTLNNWGCASGASGVPARTQYCPGDPTVQNPVPTQQSTVYFPFLDSSFRYQYDLAQAQQGVSALITDVLTYNATCSSGFRNLCSSGWDQYGNNTVQIVAQLDNDGDAVGMLSQLRTTVTNVFDYSQVSSGWLDKLVTTTVSRTEQYGASHALPSGVTSPTQNIETAYAWNCDRTLQWKAALDLNSGATGNGQSGNCAATTLPSTASGVIAITSLGYPATSYGLPNTVTINANALSSPRTTSLGYSTDNYFVATKQNPLLQLSTTRTRAEDGQIDQVVDPNGLYTNTTYDALGHAIKATFIEANGLTAFEPKIQMAYTRCPSASCTAAGESSAAYMVTTVQDGAPTEVVAYDLLGRAVDHAKRGFNGSFVHEATQYDGMGTVRSKSAPYYQGLPQYLTTFQYDALSRVMTKVTPSHELNTTQGDTRTTYTYNGHLTQIGVTNLTAPYCQPTNLCMSMSRYFNSLGQVMQTTDAQNGVTNFWYDGGSNSVGIQDANGHVTSAVYNGFGQRTSLTDPNYQASWQFSYDGLGELIQQTDARGAVTRVDSRDVLGRVLQQTASPPAVVPTGMTAEVTQDNWIYDTLVKGSPTQVYRLRGPSSGSLSNVWTENYSYDNATKQLIGRSTQIEGEGSALSTAYQYDAYYGRQKAISYPSGLTVWRQYDKYGNLSFLGDAATQEQFWTLQSEDAFGNPTEQSHGTTGTHAIGVVVGTYSASTGQAKSLSWRNASASGVIDDEASYLYDSLGNLTQQNRNGNTDTYVYDTLQRLQGAARSNGNTTNRAPVSYGYDAIGNLRYKTDYSTNASNAYTYGASGSGCGPNAASSVALAVGGTATYSCDANGNIIAGSTLTESYDPNNDARTIARTGFGSVDFRYAPGGNRYKETSTSGTTIFGSDGYERMGVASSSATHRHELGPVVVTLVNTTQTTDYEFKDRLGSVLAYGTSDANGNLLVQQSRAYDAYGRVRNADLSDKGSGTLTLAPTTIRGFTGQEHQDDVQLIHMNGRVYDYQLGRFLGVDPIIGNPLSSQSLNPYAYIGNNPLSGSDPTGFQAIPCNGNVVCQAQQNAEFLGGYVGKLRSSLTYGGAPEGKGPTNNGASGQGAKGTLATVSIGSLTDQAGKPDGTLSSPGYNGDCQVPLRCGGPASWDYGSVIGLPPTWHEKTLGLADQQLISGNPAAALALYIGDSVLSDIAQLRGAMRGDYYNSWNESTSSGPYPGLTAAGGLGLLFLGPEESAVARGGRLGSQLTRNHVAEVAAEMERRGWTITYGGGMGPEEYLAGPGGARRGSSYPDITAAKDGRKLRVNTIDTYADGVTPTKREAANAARIRAQTGEHVLLVPKPKNEP